MMVCAEAAKLFRVPFACHLTFRIARHFNYCLQVHPAKLTHALMSAAEAAAGSTLLLATVNGVTTDSSGKVTAVKVQRQQAAAEEELEADAVVLAMGPWTDAARAWLPAAPVTTGVSVCVAKGLGRAPSAYSRNFMAMLTHYTARAVLTSCC
jgi:glycerol-3-phosphate dehydrogenase